MHILRFILILLIILVVYRIYSTCYEPNNESNYKPTYKSNYKTNYDYTEPYINITNPFVDGLSQAQLGASMPDESQFLGPDSIPGDPSSSNNVINSSDIIRRLNLHNMNMFTDSGSNSGSDSKSKSKLNKDIDLIKSMKKHKKKAPTNKPKIYYPCKKLNKYFVESQFNDAYRDVLTAFNYICPDQKSFFNLQTLPVTTTVYNPKSTDPYPPFQFIKLTTQFINKLNNQIKELPQNAEIINNYNNYLPLTSQDAKYVQDKGINKFYKEIGVDYNLYADTPPNSPIELIDIVGMTREYTEAQTKYIVSMVVKKILKSVSDQLKITVHFVTKNDPLECVNLWTKDCSPPQGINTVEQIAIEYIWIDGYYTNEFDYDYDCAAQPTKKVSNIDGDDNYYSFSSLGQCNIMQDEDIIKEFNKKQREHELEMLNFNVNVPYPVYAPADKREATLSAAYFPKPLFYKDENGMNN